MIDGLKFHWKTEDLAKALRERAEHHRKRAATKEAEIPKLKEADMQSLEIIR